jgi:hypothetical protein
MEEIDLDLDLDLDTKWVDELTENETIYDEFYEQQQQTINCYIMAIDSNNTLSHISKTKIDVDAGVIRGHAISTVFSRNRLPRQRLNEVMLFCITATPEEILMQHLNTRNTTTYSPGCDIKIAATPRGLHNINSIFLLGREREIANGTKRVRVTFARKTRRKY